ncbi:hypothetical protein [Nocardia mangyaensis]|uniref:hypothetical protein n=1 Tax=Nocardia mangyaensis TaxID=2213200 RepID=UPI0026768C0F|nr:hypothetical protein [Nocardia mangyaensis]MDO3645722.1 hypothetical protein [Nocardia mangyaensis]
MAEQAHHLFTEMALLFHPPRLAASVRDLCAHRRRITARFDDPNISPEQDRQAGPRREI